MRMIAKFAGLAATAFALTAMPAAHAGTKEEGEEKLAKLLEGREAGEPRTCIPQRGSDRMRVIDKTAIVYGRGDTIYVQRTSDPEQIDDSDVLVVRRFGGSQLCRLDNVTTVDRYSGFFSGFHIFEEFVPYTRVDQDG
ncbi:hypothetical protein SAMN06297468_2992 [Altererythrobacter xiamenensis]|uniref:Uncharacterized protein n=1 Tax=Altererythrobacter xiamenensis TaxID=1316679 RepID=A0A1Y6FSJ9_9SPHN|nr:hypothetical protein [Altererythrobacter xiamenensis]SMQ75842.1 hypothetical protein SAMN06297468_2992 [Altererythrobacter xiamenensis]